jgi:hypothetical protein
MSFKPLTPEQTAGVAITRTQAEQTALANRGFGYDDANGNVKEIVWEKVGCVFLGYRIERSLVGPPPRPVHEGSAYLVQVLAGPVPGDPGLQVVIVEVDAVTGGSVGAFGGGGPPPYGVFGTTCGVTL